MPTINMNVAKSVNGKREPLGAVEVYVPSLADFGLDVAPKGTDEDGVPTYGVQELDWLQNSVKNSALANARNKLQPGTIELRPGAVMPSTLEELTTPSLGGGNPEVLKSISAVKSQFKEYVNNLGKSAKVTALLTEAFGSIKALSMQPTAVREKIAGYVEDFITKQDEEGQTPDAAQMAYLEKVLAACADEEEFDVDDL